MIYKTISPAILTKKLQILHKVLQQENRKTLILGVSGGIDSAVTLGILFNLDKTYPNIYKIIPVIAPIKNSEGTTEQHEATHLGSLVCMHFGFDPYYVDLESIAKTCTESLHLNTPYLQQQNDYWLRPMAFYAEAMKHENSILVSTTNYSEWSLGWFSQYLDILGVHPIIELYKSEVFEFAKLFSIPDEILNLAPKGGLASGRTDEQELGFTYQQFEDYESNKNLPNEIVERIKTRIKDSEFKRFRFNTDFIFRTEI